MPKFSFQVGEAEQRQGTGALKRPYWVYCVMCKTDSEHYQLKELQVKRRYSDFEWLRLKLSARYPFCIIPPVPEKDIHGTVEKFVPGSHNPSLLEYRQRALRKFLSRVGAHPYLQNSDELRNFLEQADDDGWQRYVQGYDKSDNSPIIPNVQAPPAPASAPAAGEQPYSAALSTAPMPNGTQVWEDTKTYIGQLEESVRTLKERLDALVRRRRGTSTALQDFGRNFEAVGRIEAELDNTGETGLSRAATSVGHHAGELASIYSAHATDESHTVVEALQYYVGVCEAAKETLKRLQSAIYNKEALDKSVKVARDNRESKISKGQPADKVAAATKEFEDATKRRDAAAAIVASFELNLRDELRRFHREKQYDMKEILRQFVALQRDYSDKMKRSWDDLIPTVEDVRLE